MLKVLYDRFRDLYSSILPSNPTLASEHALRQEEELYKSSSKAGYSMVSHKVATVPIPHTPI